MRNIPVILGKQQLTKQLVAANTFDIGTFF